MNLWISIMAGGPQHGLRFERAFQQPRGVPPAMRAADGKVCCPVATHTGRTASYCVVVHPLAAEHEVTEAIDAMLLEATGQPAVRLP